MINEFTSLPLISINILIRFTITVMVVICVIFTKIESFITYQ